MGGVCNIAGHHAPACTDNFQVVFPPFEAAGNKFHSTEQAFQAGKFPIGSDAFHRIANADPTGKSNEEFGMEVWRIGNSSPARDEWEEIKVKTMYAANLCKFEQNRPLADELQATLGDIKAAPSTWRWQHFNSKIMQKIRDLLVNRVSLASELERVALLAGREVEQELESY